MRVMIMKELMYYNKIVKKNNKGKNKIMRIVMVMKEK